MEEKRTHGNERVCYYAEYPPFTNTWTEEEINEIDDYIKHLPCTDVFLHKYWYFEKIVTKEGISYHASTYTGIRFQSFKISELGEKITKCENDE